MVTSQKETSPWKRQNDDDGGTPEVNNPVLSRQEGEMDIEIETEEKRTKRNDEGDLDELMQEVVNSQEETNYGTRKEENINEGEKGEEEQEQTEEGNNGEYVGMWIYCDCDYI